MYMFRVKGFDTLRGFQMNAGVVYGHSRRGSPDYYDK